MLSSPPHKDLKISVSNCLASSMVTSSAAATQDLIGIFNKILQFNYWEPMILSAHIIITHTQTLEQTHVY